MADFDDVVLSGTNYKIPKANSSPPWGEELNDYLKALGEAYSALVGPGDISETGATISNNQLSSTPVVGLSFDSVQVRSASVSFSVLRKTDSSSFAEQGNLNLIYNADNTIGEKWIIQREGMGVDTGVDFTVDDTGQISYTSSNIAGANYIGTIRFEAKATIQ